MTYYDFQWHYNIMTDSTNLRIVYRKSREKCRLPVPADEPLDKYGKSDWEDWQTDCQLVEERQGGEHLPCSEHLRLQAAVQTWGSCIVTYCVCRYPLLTDSDGSNK